ncbi:addiction module toxin RelE [Geomonas terrae]|uniref:Addiction module toxin RelE n=1 Tax=Geomonas terrae TaxID=2562681 RepID=A0A4S1CGZ9_9BACT|nr:type II toxin-antitoxin system RelE/ParE family toxin [Geomonas terrae]TGU72851.1 addiction module toxin RelE [Geomonas terrae]
MTWDIEFTDEFGVWWEDLTEAAQIDVDTVVGLLEECGPNLSFPYSSGVSGSRHSHMRELRIQHQGRPLRVLYAFDPCRTAILLLGGDKTGSNRWYKINIPIADRLYDEYLEEVEEGGN